VIRKVAMEPVYLHHLRSVLGIKNARRVRCTSRSPAPTP
jgi:hypothetical protein